MKSLYPGYDVLTKRHGPSWDRITRRVVDQRLADQAAPVFFGREEWATLQAICARIVPQPLSRETVALATMVEAKVAQQLGDGYRDTRLPPLQQAWQVGLRALMAEAQQRYRRSFTALDDCQQDQLLRCAQRNELHHASWRGMSCGIFFRERLLHDITSAFYARPMAWSAIGFGGPASPRGYVRLGANRRDSWEAEKVDPGGTPPKRGRNTRVR